MALIADLFETDTATARDAYSYLLPSFSEDGTPERAGIATILQLEQEDGPTRPGHVRPGGRRDGSRRGPGRARPAALSAPPPAKPVVRTAPRAAPEVPL